MKGGKLSRLVLQWVWLFAVLLKVSRPSVAVSNTNGNMTTPLGELHALTSFAAANAYPQRGNKNAPLYDWNISWDESGQKWAGGDPCRNFTGLVCWSAGDLKEFQLSQYGLAGAIAPQLASLTSLDKLYLGENYLNGEIGPIIANLTLMKRLRLDGNNFSGPLSNSVQLMYGLEVLTLARNSFVGNISSPGGLFTNLTSLTTVDISDNRLSGSIPDDLVSLPSLQTLLLGGNNFSGHLPEVWNATNLTSVDLSGNNLSGLIPPQLLNLSNIAQLNLANNSFHGNVSKSFSTKFGCGAFANNPGLVMDDPLCGPQAAASPPLSSPPSQSAPPPASESTFPPPPGHPLQMPRRAPLSTLIIVVLTVGNVVLIFISVVGFVMLYMWWKKGKGRTQEGGRNDPKQRPPFWPSASYRSSDHSSKDLNSIDSTGRMRRGPGPTSGEKSSFASKPDVKPSLKSVIGTLRDPSSNSVTADMSLGQSMESNDDFGTNVVILDTTLMLDFEDLLGAKATMLGAGSFGLVYTACLEDGHTLAIKRIEELALADHRAFGKRCAQLAEALHPNLLQLRAYCWSPQEKLLIFDYAKNGSVHSLLHEGKGSCSSNSGKASDWATRLKIAVGTARALAHLHDSDMVHGNIKASNVLLDEQLEPRVSDFGMERLLQTPLPQSVGANYGYLAPELAASATRRRTQEGDVYSLGVLLLELLTGKEPKDNHNPGGLPAWVQEKTTANRSVELFDPALVSMHVLPTQEVLEFLKLAQACASHDAAARPSITIVLRSLESIVPGSTAPRSYTASKDHDHQSFESDASYHETSESLFSAEFALPTREDDHERDDHDDDEDDDGSFGKRVYNPFSVPEFVKPVRVHLSPEQKLRDGHDSGKIGSPVSSAGSFYSNESSPTSVDSPSAADAVGVSPFRLTPLR